MKEIVLKTHETFHFNEEVSFQILSVRSNQVQIGFKAPREIVILRSEIRLKQPSDHSQKPLPPHKPR